MSAVGLAPTLWNDTFHANIVVMRTCPLCGDQHNRPSGYCRTCHNAYMREWRKTHHLSEEERRKSITRAYTKVLVSRGKLTKGPCSVCKATEVHAHHPDYGDPRNVVWLCPQHHRDEHDRLAEIWRSQFTNLESESP